MLAIRLYGTNDIRLDDIPVPEPAVGEALVRISHTSICATDIEVWQHGQSFRPEDDPDAGAPLVMGHEIGGSVEAVNGASNIEPGMRAVVNNVLTCRQCHWCIRGTQATCPQMRVAGLSADGGLAEFMTWPASHVIPLPDDISDSEAPILEPATVGVHAVRRSGIKAGDRAAVIGCGTVGTLTMQAALAAGASVYAIDVRQQSLELATELGADATIDASSQDVKEALWDLTDGIGPDIVFETSGVPSLPPKAVQATRDGGTTVLVGIYGENTSFDFSDIVLPEKTVVGTVAAGPGDMEAAVRLVAAGKINLKPLVSDVVGLDRGIPDGFERMLQPKKDVFRILVSPEA